MTTNNQPIQSETVKEKPGDQLKSQPVQSETVKEKLDDQFKSQPIQSETVKKKPGDQLKNYFKKFFIQKESGGFLIGANKRIFLDQKQLKKIKKTYPQTEYFLTWFDRWLSLEQSTLDEDATYRLALDPQTQADFNDFMKEKK